MAGSFAEPAAIPESVTQASAAAALAAALLRDSRGSLVEEKEASPQKDVSGQPPRIGAFICHCGINIGARVNIPAVVEFTKGLDNVYFVEENLYTCSEENRRRHQYPSPEPGNHRRLHATNP
jgi:heterodisulfide reductase subunit A